MSHDDHDYIVKAVRGWLRAPSGARRLLHALKREPFVERTAEGGDKAGLSHDRTRPNRHCKARLRANTLLVQEGKAWEHTSQASIREVTTVSARKEEKKITVNLLLCKSHDKVRSI